jgi:hypothetical protein
VIYVFEKQIEEAGLVILNKRDLLSDAKLEELQNLFVQAFPQKAYLLQNALVPKGTDSWIKHITGSEAQLPETTLGINYQRYGAGEARLAWLDEEWVIPVKEGEGREVLVVLLEQIDSALKFQKIPVGHLKFLVQAGDKHVKLSLTTLEQPGWLDDLPQFDSSTLKLLINGRVQMDADSFKNLVDEVILSNLVQSERKFTNAFHPGQPRPIYRYINNEKEFQPACHFQS